MSDNASNRPSRHQPIFQYDDHDLFGLRAVSNELVEQLRKINDSQCVLVNVGTAESKENSTLNRVINQHKYLSAMFRESHIDYLLPIQGYSWTKLERCKFPNLIISPQGTGKTYAHILYAVTKCISSSDSLTIKQKIDGTIRDDVLLLPEDMDLKPHVAHPKYIVVCSSHEHVEAIVRIIDDLKRCAYLLSAEDNRAWSMPPVAKSIALQYDETELSYRCQQSDILVGTPLSIMKCLNLGYIHFAKCNKIFFDDLDVLLQIQNNNLRELMKIYIMQTDDIETVVPEANKQTDKTSRIHFFSRKWTDLVRQFMTNLFPQRVILFGSVAEASVYYNMKFDVESYKDEDEKLTRISSLIEFHRRSFPNEKLCIVTSTDEEGTDLGERLVKKNQIVKIIACDEDLRSSRIPSRSRSGLDLVFVISDSMLEFLVEASGAKKPLDDVVHIIHATLPDDIIVFDQRFRLAFRHIREEKGGLATTILIGPDFKMNVAKNVYDLMSRSIRTQTASKLTMRDYIIERMPATRICWRWATTGLCRLEKLSRDDRFGSYCFDRHSLPHRIYKADASKPDTGQVVITITHILSPSEFYFRFESHRNFEDGKWIKVRESGNENMQKLQAELQKLKSADPGSVPLNNVHKGRLFAVYFQELARVDRVRLLDEVKHESLTVRVNSKLEYSKLIPVIKIDYGILVHVKVRNLISLSKEAAQFPAQAHRGFHLGYKPTDNEPNWLSHSKERFFRLVTDNGPCTASAWLRLNCDGCFWFENLTISRQLSNIDSYQVSSTQPHRQLHQEGLSDLAPSEPNVLSPSTRLFTMCKWNHDKVKDLVAFAFIERLPKPQKIFLIDVSIDFTVSIRQEKFDKQLREVENRISHDFIDGKLQALNYFEPNVYCIARVTLPSGKTHWNRVKISEIIDHEQDIESHDDAREPEFRIECLDYGDFIVVERENLYQASPDHIKTLPFQAIRRKMANINNKLLVDENSCHQARELILRLIDDNTPILCEIDENDELYLYASNICSNMFEPLSMILENHDLRLFQESIPQYEQIIKMDIEPSKEDTAEEEPRPASDYEVGRLNEQILKLLRELVSEELEKSRLESKE